jgi:hypothetical protein
METQNFPRVQMEDLGLYLTTIQAEFQPRTRQEMADFISHYFKVICLPEDIVHYEELHAHHKKIEQDWELESRREAHFQKLGLQNPFT